MKLLLLHILLFSHLNHYFDYFKKQRVNELESIAQDLGAKHVKIVFQEHEKFIVKNNSRTNVKTGTLESNTSYESSRSDDAKFEIAADIHFFGQDAPKPPHLSTSNVRVILKNYLKCA